MKKIVIVIVLSSVMILSSCKDFLNMPPKNTRVVYTTDDVRGVMSLFLFATLNAVVANGNYEYISYFNGKMVFFPYNRVASVMGSVSSDDMDLTIFYNASLPSGEINRGGIKYLAEYTEARTWESYKFANKVWGDVFHNVGFLNRILVDLNKTNDYDKTKFEQISGEARVFRAYYLLRLNQLFAPYDKNDYGIPYNLDGEVYTGGPRKKQTDLYRELIGELNDVLNYETEPKPSWNILFNKRIINAILAQTYMYKAESCAKESSDWANAEKHARIARNDEPVESTVAEQSELVYVPADRVLFKPHKFCLFRFSSLSDCSVEASNNYYAPYGNPASLLLQAPSDELYALYDDTDIRKEVYFRMQNEKPYFLKMRNLGSIDYYNLNVMLFRHSDMMLIEAEAMARQGNNAGALNLLNEFKRAKIVGFTNYTGTDVLGEILRERRKEFVLEEQMRWIDMKRNKVSVTRKVVNPEDASIEEHSLTGDDYRYALPIPADLELNYNPIPQNPGWKY